MSRERCELNFSEPEMVEFFGTAANFEEDSYSYSFSTSRDGLLLETSLFPLTGEVWADLYREGITDSVARIRLEGCSHSRVVTRGADCWLEIGRPEHPVSDMGIPPVLVWGLRLRIDPHISLEYIHEDK